MTDEMWLPSRKDANRPRAGALQNSTCPAGLSTITGSGSASAMRCMAEVVRETAAGRSSAPASAWSPSGRGSSTTEATKLTKPIRAKALERPAISTSDAMITPTATISHRAALSLAPTSRKGRMTAWPTRPKSPGSSVRTLGSA